MAGYKGGENPLKSYCELVNVSLRTVQK